MKPRDQISAAIRNATARGRPALVGFLTAGFPNRRQFNDHLAAVASVCDVVEIGVPFTDPMADGMTIQRASHAALSEAAARERVLRAMIWHTFFNRRRAPERAAAGR